MVIFYKNLNTTDCCCINVAYNINVLCAVCLSDLSPVY